jgi:hypothetical protein
VSPSLTIHTCDQFLIFAIIAAQFGLYILIRQLVNTKEWLLACKLHIHCNNTFRSFKIPGRGRKGLLRKRLRGANTYQVRSCFDIGVNPLIRLIQEWKEAAAILDEYLGFDDWKKIDEDAFYDWKLVRKVEYISRIELSSLNDVR